MVDKVKRILTEYGRFSGVKYRVMACYDMLRHKRYVNLSQNIRMVKNLVYIVFLCYNVTKLLKNMGLHKVKNRAENDFYKGSEKNAEQKKSEKK